MKQYNTSEQQLLSNLIEDDASAFDSLYWKYHRPVFSNIIKFIKDQDKARDLLQEVFIALWIKRKTLDPSLNIGGWLFVISYHKCIDHLKRTIAEPLLMDEGSLADELIDTGKEREEENRLQLLLQAVKQLSPQKRKVFELCKLKGKTYEEAALELNISKHTVKEYLTAAMRLIKEYIREQAPHAIQSAGIVFLLSIPPSF
ncbi:MAG: sigma-70 family RNA polymerase sigma factor [Chitinophagaceae bacterium]|nr:sigma-70 family RNA polymerase sigma factor [Chitinophagaceae bacterium]